MAREIEDPGVLHASDTVDTSTDDDPTIVRETRPAAVPVNAATTDEPEVVDDAAPATYGERQVILHRRYGGMDMWADFLGFTVALFCAEILLGIVAAVGFGYLHAQVPTIGGHISSDFIYLGIGGLGAVFLAYLIGGYAAGRMARFDGGKNGFGVWLWTLLVAIALGIIAAIAVLGFGAGSEIHLKAAPSTVAATIGALVAVTAVVMLVGAILGGLMGNRYHRSIDRQGEAL